MHDYCTINPILLQYPLFATVSYKWYINDKRKQKKYRWVITHRLFIPTKLLLRGVSIDLSSRAASRQVLWAQVSLTSVFGMGTGGPSLLKTLTNICAVSGIGYALFCLTHSSLIYYTHKDLICQEVFQLFLNCFHKPRKMNRKQWMMNIQSQNRNEIV